MLLTALSLAPFAIKYELGTKGRLHDFGHFATFLFTAALVSCTAKTVGRKLTRYLAVCGMAILLEALETAIYGNPFEWHDVATDALGGAAGIAIVTIVPWLFSRNDSLPPENRVFE